MSKALTPTVNSYALKIKKYAFFSHSSPPILYYAHLRPLWFSSNSSVSCVLIRKLCQNFFWLSYIILGNTYNKMYTIACFGKMRVHLPREDLNSSENLLALTSQVVQKMQYFIFFMCLSKYFLESHSFSCIKSLKIIIIIGAFCTTVIIIKGNFHEFPVFIGYKRLRDFIEKLIVLYCTFFEII